MHNIRIIFITIISLLTATAQAETVYVIDELKIGLHESPSITSPITKLVTSGTELTVIERSEGLVRVTEPEGTSGWINNKYVIIDKPGKARVSELEKEIELLKSTVPTMTISDEAGDQGEIEQQLKSERLKSGALQAQLTDLRAKIADVDNSELFLADIEQLKQENAQLVSQLESSGIEVETAIHSSIGNWKQHTTAFIIILIIGMLVGVFGLDHLNSRRHGGFRI
jgi:SH3 domain protein